MRKVFAGATIFSLIGAALLGGVFAFQVSDHASGENQVGYAGLEISEFQQVTEYRCDMYQYCGEMPVLIGPNGQDNIVAVGELNNPGMYLVGNFTGEVKINSTADEYERGPDVQKCNTTDFHGWVWFEGEGQLDPNDYDLGDEKFSVLVGPVEDAPDSCQGNWVGWEVWIFGETIAVNEHPPMDDMPEPTS
jgi:hypothetical protein